MKIESYNFGRITVDGKLYTSDVIVSPDGVDDTWWRQKGHELAPGDLEPVWKANPEVLVIGTGAYGVMKVQPETDRLMRQRCAEVHVLPTTEAWRRYNELAARGDRRVVAALHLTC